MFEKVHQLTSASCGPPKGIVFDGYANGDIIFTQVPVSPHKLMNIRNVDASRCAPSSPAGEGREGGRAGGREGGRNGGRKGGRKGGPLLEFTKLGLVL